MHAHITHDSEQWVRPLHPDLGQRVARYDETVTRILLIMVCHGTERQQQIAT